VKVQPAQFREVVWTHYTQHGRHDLPWRKTTDPYKIVVSEMMLQQTQVSRVLPKYKAFVKQWRSARALANAPLSAVLEAWQGLGYNRRAKSLHECAKQVVQEHDGRWPRTYAELLKLPGIGPYTAGAVMAFSYNEPVPIIETNIRTVYLHHFFADVNKVTEIEILRLSADYLDQKNPREWYWALMDYGAHLKQAVGNPNKRAISYTKQSPFAGSDRQIRGAIIKLLTTGSYTLAAIHASLAQFSNERIARQLVKLTNENMVQKHRQRYSLPD